MSGPVLDATLHQALREAERTLESAGVWSPREDAEALAAHALGIEPGALHGDLPLGPEPAARFARLVARRADRIPLGHVIGRVTVAGLDIEVGDDVFVPRIHTEPLITWGLQKVSALERPVVVDLCTGAGAAALAVAHARPDARVHAVDLDPAALEWARRNAERREAAGDTPVALHRGDVTDPGLFGELTGRVDLVLANPPFVPEGTALLPEWGEHHPRQSIFSGSDGLTVIRGVVDLATRLLRPGGGLAIEHGDPQIAPVAELLGAQAAFTGITGNLDHEGRPRYTTAHRAS
jgi:release factor glutamine methyltransferase